MMFYRVLELAVAHAPVRYKHIIVTKRRLGQCLPLCRKRAATHRAWSALPRAARGGLLILGSSG